MGLGIEFLEIDTLPTGFTLTVVPGPWASRRSAALTSGIPQGHPASISRAQLDPRSAVRALSLAAPRSTAATSTTARTTIRRRYIGNAQSQALLAGLFDCCAHGLAHAQVLSSIAHIATAQLRYVQHGFSLKAHINEGTKASNRSNDPLHHSTSCQANRIGLRIEQFRQTIAHTRVATREGQLAHQIAPGALIHSEVSALEALADSRPAQGIRHIGANALKQASHQGILLWVQRSAVERLFGLGNPQEGDRAGPLSFSQHLFQTQFLAGLDGSLCTTSQDPLHGFLVETWQSPEY